MHPEVAAEQAHLDRAHARIEEIAAEARAIVEEARAGERGGALFQRFERDAAEALGEARLARFDLGEQALCFGRIDLHDEDDPLHIGRLGVLDADGTPLVVDWRAPVSERFYRATVGEPLGVVRRRHISSRGRRVLDLDDELLDTMEAAAGLVLVGEAALLTALGRTRRGRMEDIVSTIQAEQDAIVRAPLASVLVVQGGPGTGKTAVGLHRVAYLLYSHRLLLERQGVLLVGPNPTFLRYVEHVVPSLGETNLRLATPTDLVEHARASTVDEPDLAAVKADGRMAELLRRAVAQRERAPRTAVDVPDGARTLRLRRQVVSRIVSRAQADPRPHNALRPAVVTAILRALWRARLDHVAAPPTRSGLDDPESDALADAALAELGEDGATLVAPDERADPALAPGHSPDAQDVRARPPMDPAWAKRMRSVPEVRALLERTWPVLTADRVLDDLLGTPALLAAAAEGVLTGDEVERLHRPRSEEPRWSEHDLPLLDELAALVGPQPVKRRRPPPRPLPGEQDIADQVLSAEAFGNIEGGVDPVLRAALRERLLGMAAEDRGAVHDPPEEPGGADVAGHVVVDEAQDVSPMQWRALARRTTGSSLTLLGDLAQGSHPWSARSWDDVLRHLDRTEADTSVVELGIGYRTPAEVMVLARRVLAAIDPSLRAPEAVRTAGVEPRLLDAGADLAAVVAEERAALEGGTVAVLCPAGLVAGTAAALGVRPALGADALDRDVAVLSAEAAKGLEFDAVVVIEPTGMRLPSLYVALTRTTRRLAVVGPLP